MEAKMTVRPDSALGRSREFGDWLRKHDLDPRDVYRVDVADKSFIAYRYHRVGGKLHFRSRCPSIQYPDEPLLMMSEGEGEPCRLIPVGRKLRAPLPGLVDGGEDREAA